jgi:hypothetical protein
VHYNSKFPDLKAAEASGETSALLVVAQLFAVDSRLAHDSAGIRSVVSAIRSLARSSNREADISVPLSDLVDVSHNQGYYAYAGGLTNPDCTAPVTWVVMGGVKRITQGALDVFKLVKTSTGESVAALGNVRPLQPRGGREVFQLGECADEGAPRASLARRRRSRSSSRSRSSRRSRRSRRSSRSSSRSRSSTKRRRRRRRRRRSSSSRRRQWRRRDLSVRIRGRVGTRPFAASQG